MLERAKVRHFNEAKRLGYLATESGDLFFHFDSGAGLRLEHNSRDGLVIAFNEGEVPARMPQKGDAVVFIRGRGEKGPKAATWAFANEEIEATLELVVSLEGWWYSPKFAAFRNYNSCGTNYYAYYPVPEAFDRGMEVRNFETLLLYKKGDQVVTGRTVQWTVHGVDFMKHCGQAYPVEPVYGIIPPDAKDGFWFHNGRRWEHCREVEVVVKTLSVGKGKPEPCNYRFVGLRTEETNQLVPSCDPFFDLDLFQFSHRDAEDGMPRVEDVHVRKGCWFTERERQRYMEQKIVPGYSPGLIETLERIEAGAAPQVSKIRITESESKLDVNVDFRDGANYRFEYCRGSEIPGMPGDPTQWIERVDGTTYIFSHWEEYPEDNKFRKAIKVLEDLLRVANRKAGPLEEASLRESKGLFCLKPTGSGDSYAIYCPHGWRSFPQNLKKDCAGRREDEANLIDREFEMSKCPYGCEHPYKIKPQAICVRAGDSIRTKYGLPIGIIPVEEAKKRIAARKERLAEAKSYGYQMHAGFLHVFPERIALVNVGIRYFQVPMQVFALEDVMVNKDGAPVVGTRLGKSLPGLFTVVKEDTGRTYMQYKDAGKELIF